MSDPAKDAVIMLALVALVVFLLGATVGAAVTGLVP